MTLKDLSQLYYLTREIEMDKQRLKALESRAVDCSAGLSSTPGRSGPSDIVGFCAADIADLRGIIEAKQQQCLYERNRLERYISSIDNSMIRQIFTCRFIDRLPWEQVAACVGGSNTGDGCRMVVKRYLQKN